MAPKQKDKNVTQTLSHEDRDILERKVNLGINREVETTAKAPPDDVATPEVTPLHERNRALVNDYVDYIEYIDELLRQISERCAYLSYKIVPSKDADLAAAIAALYDGLKEELLYSDYVQALELEAAASSQVIAQGEGADTTYLQQVRGNASQVARGFDQKLAQDNTMSENIGFAMLTRPLIIAKSTAQAQQNSLVSYNTTTGSGGSDDDSDQTIYTIYGKEVTNTFTKIASGDDPIQTILDDCIPCLDRALDMDLMAPLDTFLDDLEADLENRWNILQNIADLLDSEDIYEDICDLLDFLSFQCIPDMVAILSALLWFWKSLTFSFSLDINGSLWSLLGLIMGPFFSSLEAIIDQYIQMLMAPVDCIIDSLLFQMSKIPQLSVDFEYLLQRQREQAAFQARAAVGDEAFASINASIDSKLNFLALEATSWEQSKRAGISDPDSQSTYSTPLTLDYKPQTRILEDGSVVKEDEVVEDYQEYIKKQEEKQREQATVADYLRDAENVLQTGLGSIGGYLIAARDKINSWLESLLEDIRAFLGGSSDDFTLAVSYATTLKRLSRLIAIVRALIKMAEDGLQCGPDKNVTEPDVLSFLQNYLAPEIGAEVIVSDDGNVVIVTPGSAPPSTQDPTTSSRARVGGASGEADLQAQPVGVTIALSNCINKVDLADLRKVEEWIKQINS